MENKLNFSALEQYAAEYSGLLADKLFEQKPTLTGRDILEKIPVKQIGLFTLFQLFEKWKSEIEQLKSPYFDYESNEVQTKMKELMNALSKNISISREHLLPLFAKATEDTLLLILSPLEYYENLVESFGGKAPTMDDVKDLQKFIKINGHMRDALLEAWASNSNEGEVLDKAFEDLNEPPEDVNTLLEPFNQLLSTEGIPFWEGGDEPISMAETVIEEDEEADFETVHKQFTSGGTTMLGDTLGFETTKTSLKSMLTINQKFMFVNDLFKGNQEDFVKVIDFLDTCETKDVVIKFLSSNYIKRGEWKLESPQVKEFMSLIDKKFN